MFPQLFRVLPNFHECFYNSIETLYMFSVSFRKHPRDFVSGNIEILGKQNSLFPSGPVIKCLILLNVQQVEETESYMN